MISRPRRRLSNQMQLLRDAVGTAVTQREPLVSPSHRRTVTIVTLGVVLVVLTVLSLVAFQRGYFNYDTETDYIGGFVPEAIHLLAGEPLEVEFHPPVYPIAIALAYTLLGDWFVAGVVLSLLASLATFLLAFVLARELLGVWAGVGAAAALLLSHTFLAFSMQATSDVFSTALHLGATFAVVMSARRRTLGSALAAGAVVGIAMLARTNNVVLLGLFAFYLVQWPAAGVLRSARRAAAAAAVGVCLPLVAWYAFASATGAPLLPTKNHENLALTYFSDGDRQSGEARRIVAREFTSTLDVLTADPLRIARIYVTDLIHLARRLLATTTVVPFPLVALGVVAWLAVLAIDTRRRGVVAMLLANLVLMVLLINLKFFEDRYYLFLVPFLGAAIGHVAWLAFASTRSRVATFAAALLGITLIGGSAVSAWSETRNLHEKNWATDAHAAAPYITASPEGTPSLIVSRKSHIAFYAGAEKTVFPQVTTLDELRTSLQDGRDASRVTYLFYGAVERRGRPELSALDRPATPVPGFETVASGPERGGWTLFLVEPAASTP